MKLNYLRSKREYIMRIIKIRSVIAVIVMLLVNVTNFSYAAANEKTNEKSKRIIAGFIKQQAKSNVSIGRSISTILSRYPEQVDAIVPIALELYPDKYKQIIIGAINAESALACDVVEAAINSNIVESDEIVRIAIEADPAYANEIIETAATNDIEEIQNIIRVGITIEGTNGKDVMKSALASFPEQLVGILSGAIQALPNQVTEFVASAINLFPSKAEQVVTTAVSQNTNIGNREIVNKAIANGVSETAAIDAAIAGGANQQELIVKDQ